MRQARLRRIPMNWGHPCCSGGGHLMPGQHGAGTHNRIVVAEHRFFFSFSSSQNHQTSQTI